MLKLVHDNRSGKKLELVVPTFNEERRINNILKYYGYEFDVVLLDDGSSDATVEMALRAGASVYRRIGEGIGENHFVHYVNEMTKSGHCFYMFADEFIKKAELHEAEAGLRQRPCVVLGRRVDWVYGHRIVAPSSATPRGLSQGDAIYNPDRLHASLEYRAVPTPRLLQFDVHHLHLWSMKTYFGQAGRYAYQEVEQFRKQRYPAFHFLKRFVAYELLMLPRRLWRERGKGFAFLLWMSGMSFAVTFLAILSWVEQRYLRSTEQQLELYAKFYSDDSSKP